MFKKPARRLLAALLAVMTTVSLVACSSEEPEAPAEDVEIVAEAEPTEEAEEIAAPEEPTPDPIPEPEPEPEPTPEPSPELEPATQPEPEGLEYVLNTGTMKFHYPTCSSVKTIKDKNRADFTGTRDDLMARGFDPCGKCHP